MGDGGVRSPIWWNNQRWNHEEFEDANGNGLHDAGENFVDGNGNGAYDEELYDPATTGYRTPLDLGRELVLLPAGLATAPAPGQYFAVSLPPVNKGTPQTGNDPYRLHWSSCAETPVEPGDVLQTEALALIGPTNQEMQNRIALDPDAA